MELFKLLGTIAIDTADMEKAFKKAREDGGQTEKKLNSAFSKMGGAAVAFGKTVMAGVAAGATAVGGIVAKSVSAYADYEQLVGGVETLFKGSADAVIKYASDAYKTAGLSANEYMETVTSFSASLLQSLGGDTVAAAEYADLAITDMSDNANKMGTDMSLIQNAYQGFAKQNYTMLDNLKLGYGGTQEEMQRLIDDANKLKEAQGEAADLTIDSYADVVEAIHTVQTEIGITGTTAKEAEGTISGSIAMTKSAWENLMTGLAQGNADIPALVTNVISSGTKVLENIIPVAKQVLQNIPKAISEISPEAGAAFQKIVDVGSKAIEGLKSVIEPTIAIIKSIYEYVKENTWVLTATATAIGIIVTAMGMYNAVSAIKTAMAAAEVTTVWGLVSAYAAQAVAMAAAIAPYLLIAAAIAAVIAIGVALYKNWDTVKEKCAELGDKLSQIWDNIKQSVSKAWEFIKNAVKVGLMFIAEIVKAAFSLITLPFRFIWENCKEYVFTAFEWIKEKINIAIEFIKNLVTVGFGFVKEYIINPINEAKDRVSEIFGNIKDRISNVLNSVKNTVSNALSKVKTSFSNSLSNAYNTVTDKLNTIRDKFSSIMDSAKEKVHNAIEAIKEKFNFTWSLPKLKLPHISISGKFSLNPPSVPKFSIAWYKKAMENAMILSNPTIFGYGGGKFLGGGEAGNEVVAGESHLMKLIQNAVSSQNAGLVDVLYKILDAIIAMDENMGGNLREALEGTAFEVNRREFARLVKAVN